MCLWESQSKLPIVLPRPARTVMWNLESGQNQDKRLETNQTSKRWSKSMNHSKRHRRRKTSRSQGCLKRGHRRLKRSRRVWLQLRVWKKVLEVFIWINCKLVQRRKNWVIWVRWLSAIERKWRGQIRQIFLILKKKKLIWIKIPSLMWKAQSISTILKSR